MLKKCISITLALLMMFSAMVVGVSAADVDEAATGDDTLIYFDAASAGWQNVKYIMFYIYNVETGTELVAWGSKKTRGTKGENDIWSFDPTTIGMVEGAQYAIIFNNDEGGETYQLLMDSTCYGDTAYCDDTYIENPVDSNKTSREARWRNSSLGPMLAITSLGHVVGETCPAHTTPYAMFVKFLTSDGSDGLQNAVNYSGRSQEEVIQSVASLLFLTDEDVEHALEEAGLGGDPGLYTLEGSVASYLDDSDVTLTLEGSRITAHLVIGTGEDYSFQEIPADTYTLTVKKNNHVDREYEVKVTGDTTLDVKICPLGDVTMDGQVTTMDVTRANAHVKGKATLEGYALECADVLPQTAGITTMDVTRINSHVQKARPLW